jgi:hypothetical protein
MSCLLIEASLCLTQKRSFTNAPNRFHFLLPIALYAIPQLNAELPLQSQDHRDTIQSSMNLGCKMFSNDEGKENPEKADCQLGGVGPSNQPVPESVRKDNEEVRISHLLLPCTLPAAVALTLTLL